MRHADVWRAAGLFIGLTLLCVAVRVAGDWGWIPAPPNFKPMAGAAMLAGMLFATRRMAIAVPLVAMLVSDSLIGFYDWRQVACVYAALLLPVALGRSLQSRFGVIRLASYTLVSSVFFYAVSNAAVWAFGTMYAHDAAGFLRCMSAGLPFFKYTLAGDVVWTTALFGGWLLATRGVAGFQSLVESVAGLFAKPAPQRVRKQ